MPDLTDNSDSESEDEAQYDEKAFQVLKVYQLGTEPNRKNGVGSENITASEKVSGRKVDTSTRSKIGKLKNEMEMCVCDVIPMAEQLVPRGNRHVLAGKKEDVVRTAFRCPRACALIVLKIRFLISSFLNAIRKKLSQAPKLLSLVSSPTIAIFYKVHILTIWTQINCLH